MGPEGTQANPVVSTPIGRIPTEDQAPLVPTLNPSDSPYTPLELPTVEPKQIPVPEASPEPQNLGAVNHAGAIAYVADKILRGALQGYDFAQAHKAEQYNKKLAAQQQILNEQAQQFKALSQAGYGPVISDPSQLSPNSPQFQAASPEWKAAYNRVNAIHQAILQTIGERIPQPKKSKKSQQGQANGVDQSNLIQRVANHKNDPQDALQAWYQIAHSTGPSVFLQSAQYFTPQYHQWVQRKAQTQGTEAQGAQDAATAHAAMDAAQAEYAQALNTGDPEKIAAAQKKVDALKVAQSAASKYPVQGIPRYRMVNGVEHQYNVDQEGKEIPGTDHVRSAAAATIKPLKYDSSTDRIIDLNTGKSYSPTDPNLPPDVASIFDGVKRALKNKSITTSGIHTYMIKRGDQTVPVQVETVTTKSVGGSGNGAGLSHSAVSHQGGVVGEGAPIGYVDSPEYKAAVKQNTDAKNAFNSAATNLRLMAKTAPEARRGNGAAQVGIISAYLKTVVGGQGTGVRITKPEWDAVSKTRPWMQGIKATFSPDGVMTGASISPEQVNQMVNEVNQKTKSLFETMQQAKTSLNAAKSAEIPSNLASSVDSSSTLPEAAKAQLKEGHVTRFANGQTWTLNNGKPVRVGPEGVAPKEAP